MKRILRIFQRDLRHIVRDKSILIILFIPIVFWFLLKFLPPLYEPLVPVLKAYRLHIIAVFCILASVLPGFVMSFIILEEKDEHLLALFRILPIPIQQFTLYRALLIMLFGFLSSFVIIWTTGLIKLSILKMFFLSIVSSSTGPAITFLITGVAHNKIEGVTLFKLFSFITILPIAAFFIKVKLSLFFGLLPYYWIYSGFIGRSFLSFNLSITIALCYNLIFFIASYRFYIQRINR